MSLYDIKKWLQGFKKKHEEANKVTLKIKKNCEVAVCDCVIPDYSDESGVWCRRCNAKIL